MPGKTPPHTPCPCGIAVSRDEDTIERIETGVYLFFGMLIHAIFVFFAFINGMPTGFRLLLLAEPTVFLLGALLVQRRAGHRGWCWVRRTLFYFLVGPMVLFEAFTG